MESLWIWTLYLIVIILYLNNVTALSQDLPAGKAPLTLPMPNSECFQPYVRPPIQIIRPLANIAPMIGEYSDIPLGRILLSDNQQIYVLPERISASPSLNVSPTHRTYPSFQHSTPCIPIPQCNTPIQTPNLLCNIPFDSAPLILPGAVPPPAVLPPVLTLTSSTTPTEISSIYCPPFTSANPSRLVPVIQPQVSINGFQSSLPLPDIAPQPNIQYLNYSPSPNSLRIIPLSQSQVFPLENSLPLQILPDYLPQPNVQLPVQSYPLTSQYEPIGTPYAKSISTLPENTFPVSIFQNSNAYPPFYQVASLPPVLPTVPFITEPPAYSSNQFINAFQIPVTETVGNSQIPITLQMNMPESPAPIISIISPTPPYANAIPPSVPPISMSPIVIGKSKSRWKNWLPAFILALFTNNRGDSGCGGSGRCCYCCRRPNNTPENVYIPFPIPISTNNPIICNKGSSLKTRGCDNYNDEVNSD